MLIAGTVDLSEVMAELAKARPAFHSEADFQHAFAWQVHRADSTIDIRLEIPQGETEHLDMLCAGPAGRTAIELKYFTAAWKGAGTLPGELFLLPHQAVTDKARFGFVNNIVRLEKLCREADPPTNGLSLLLTNEPSLWTAPNHRRWVRDMEFRIHEEQTLSGTLRWGNFPKYHPDMERTLAGTYPLRWHDFSTQPGRSGTFRWLSAGIDTPQRKP
ncbi:hypothetical protein [Dactylosporangium sp. CA-233914]|uniref:hypothetical protein n=1 Tax=Dactylosporangium sp. CA-233914 TaxID=3239934 RepID=UPI003D901AB7